MDGITQQKKHTDRNFSVLFLLPHGVIHAKKKVKSEKFAIIFLILKLRGLKRLEKSI